MGTCDTLSKNHLKQKSKFNSSKNNSKYSSSFSSLVPDLSSLISFQDESVKVNLKKYNSMGETSSLQNNRYILPERISKREDITKKYRIINHILGDGATAKVYLAEDFSGKKFAIKCIPKEKIEIRKKIILKEAEICSILNNKNIIKYYELYEDYNFVNVVMEKADTDLFELIVNNPLGYIPEEIAIDFLIQIFEVIDYLHNVVNIVHCDIKPENFVIIFNKEKGNKPILKLIDFGNVRRKPMNKKRLYNFVGTKEYMAPEALENGGFNEKVDVCAAGIIMFNLLTGADPFISPNDNESDYIDNIKFKEIKFEYIKNEKLRELNKKLLNRFLARRITAKEALEEIKQIKNELFNNNDINYNRNINNYDKNWKIIINKFTLINMS
jgi:serine/threonine protein kinase